jgi:hypothetical protein
VELSEPFCTFRYDADAVTTRSRVGSGHPTFERIVRKEMEVDVQGIHSANMHTPLL